MYHILLLKPKYAPDGKPRDKLIKIDCKSATQQQKQLNGYLVD